MSPSRPTGTVTFLFTDIEGSTRLWEVHPDAMRVALARHDALLHGAIAQAGGYLVKTTGDGVIAAFDTAPAAVSAALTAQIALGAEAWPVGLEIAVRMALHTGAAQLRDGDYFGPDLNRTARLLAVGHGGQTLVSGVTQELCRDRVPAGVAWQDLGTHELKDLGRPERIFQLTHPDLPDSFPPLQTRRSPDLPINYPPNNLPQQITSFVGREKPLADVTALLGKTHLLTLTGSGGAGKTRLSLQVAADVLDTDTYPDGAWLVELAPLSDPALVPQAVAGVLGVREQTGQTIEQGLNGYLLDKRLLLLLDNCEHVLSVCARLTASLLRACPGMRVLATSREPLGIGGEQTYRVPSLTLPPPQEAAGISSADLSTYEAVRLFTQRAQAVRADFAVNDANAPALAQLCFHLDGIPLALELAAARVRSLSVEDINARLDSRFRLLTGGDRSALPRQQTLRALVDWSYDLLTDSEKTLLARLSVFAGGWTLPACEAVCGFAPLDEGDVLDILTSLVDKSLVVADEEATGSKTRYRLLETLRQYGAEKLAASGEVEVVRSGHLAYFARFAQEAQTHRAGPDQGLWLDRLEADHDNLRQALENAPASGVADSAGLRLAGLLWWFWYTRGYLSEGSDRLTRALAAQVSGDRVGQEARALALRGAGVFAMIQGAYQEAQDFLNESLQIFRGLGDKKEIAASLVNLGNIAYYQGDNDAAQSLYEEGLSLQREIGDEMASAGSLRNLGLVLLRRGDTDAAQTLFEQSLAIMRGAGHTNAIAGLLRDLGGVAQIRNDSKTAQNLFGESLAAFRALGDKGNVANLLATLASLFLQQSRFRVAALLWGADDGLRASIGMPLPPHEQGEYRAAIEATRAALGDGEYTAAWNEGRALTMDGATDFALAQQDDA